MNSKAAPTRVRKAQPGCRFLPFEEAQAMERIASLERTRRNDLRSALDVLRGHVPALRAMCLKRSRHLLQSATTTMDDKVVVPVQDILEHATRLVRTLQRDEQGKRNAS